MSHSEAPISITTKSPAGSLITVRANNGEELDTLVANALASITSAVQELEGLTKNSNANAVAYATKALGATVIDVVPTVQPTTQLAGGRSCPHGKMTAIQGVGKDGLIYKGYFCPSPQGAVDKCKNVYLKSNSADWNTFVPDKIK